MAIGNTMMLLMKPSPAQGGKPFSFPHCVTKVGRPVPAPYWLSSLKGGSTLIAPYYALLRERITGTHVAAAEALLKPVHALLRAAVGEGFRIYVSGRHALQAGVGDSGGGI